MRLCVPLIRVQYPVNPVGEVILLLFLNGVIRLGVGFPGKAPECKQVRAVGGGYFLQAAPETLVLLIRQSLELRRDGGALEEQIRLQQAHPGGLLSPYWGKAS